MENPLLSLTLQLQLQHIKDTAAYGTQGNDLRQRAIPAEPDSWYLWIFSPLSGSTPSRDMNYKVR